MKGKELAEYISKLVLAKKAHDVIIMDLQGLTSIADFFVICTVDSEVQAKAVREHLADELIYQSIRPWHIEGNKTSNWMLLDFIDVVVHIFNKETREFYSLERLWGDANMIHVKDDDETSGISAQ